MRKMSLREFMWKAYKNLHNRYVLSHRQDEYKKYCLRYFSYRHSVFSKAGKRNANTCRNYFSARPNPGAGIGHQIANWIAGKWFAKMFDLEFAHIPFSSQNKPFIPNDWEQFLGFGENEITVKELLKKGYKPILLPLFDENNVSEIECIKKIIDSYSNQKVVFIAEQDQFYKAQYGMMDEIQKKFHESTERQKDSFVFLPGHINIVVHARRGDIVQKPGENNPNLTMRYQSLDYFTRVLDQILQRIKTEKTIDIFLMSQGNKEEYACFDKYDNIHYCLDMPAKDSFLHMINADVLITSKSSFSYKPALLNKTGIKVCPGNFWHGYPQNDDWILVSDEGDILGGSLIYEI